MWKAVVDESLRQVDTNTNFFEALRGGAQPTVMVELLNTSFQQVEGGTIFSADRSNRLTNFITDGNIDVDSTRGIRRTSELTLLNPTAEFTPATQDFESEGPWVGMIYLNRMVRIYRGVYVDDHPQYVPVGTFMIDVAEVLAEQNMSLVNLTLSDRWKMIAKSFFGNQKVYDEGTNYNAIIRDIIDAAGIPMNGKFGAVIDSLNDRPADERKIQRKVKFERGASRGDELLRLTNKWDIDVYFDPMGAFRSEDRRDSRDKQQVWHYYTSTDNSGMIVNLSRSFSDDNLYNHVIIIGTGNKKGIVRAERRDNNPKSKTSINLIGDRVFFKESDQISTQGEADKFLNRIWQRRFSLIETLSMKAICNPALEADDIIRITERDYVKIDERYRLDRFNVPLVTSAQDLNMDAVIRRDDL